MFRNTVRNLLPHIKQNAREGDVEGVLTAMNNFPFKEAVEVDIFTKGKCSVLDTVVQKFNPRAALMLGCSFGCAAIRIAFNMKKPGSKLLAVEPNSETCALARRIIEYAGLSERVIVLNATVGKGTLEKKGERVKDFLRRMEASHFDFIYMNNYPSTYMPDFLFLEDQGMLAKGTVIVANTISSSGRPYRLTETYLKYLKDHPEELETETYRCEPTSRTEPPASMTKEHYQPPTDPINALTPLPI